MIAATSPIIAGSGIKRKKRRKRRAEEGAGGEKSIRRTIGKSEPRDGKRPEITGLGEDVQFLCRICLNIRQPMISSRVDVDYTVDLNV